MTYQEIVTELGNKFIKKIDARGLESWIPVDESNSDYQRYLRWLEDPTAEEGGTLS